MTRQKRSDRKKKTKKKTWKRKIKKKKSVGLYLQPPSSRRRAASGTMNLTGGWKAKGNTAGKEKGEGWGGGWGGGDIGLEDDARERWRWGMREDLPGGGDEELGSSNAS